MIAAVRLKNDSSSWSESVCLKNPGGARMSELLNDISGETVLLGFSMYLRVLRYRPPSFAGDGIADPAVATVPGS
jgi:hypothetical protein